MVSAIIAAAEIIQFDYTNTECFWLPTYFAKNIVLVSLKPSRVTIPTLNVFGDLTKLPKT